MSIKRSAQLSRYGFGPGLPTGYIDVQELDDGVGFTVTRIIDGQTWIPLSGPESLRWLTWPCVLDAAWVHLVRPVKDHLHWGAAPT